MKKLLPFYLYPNFLKTIGIIVSVAGIFLFLFLNKDYQLLFYFGLIFVIYSKERKESELIEKIRAETFKTIFGYFIAFLFVIFLIGIIYKDISFPCFSFLLVGFPMILYIFYFNLLLIINLGKEVENRKSVRLGYFLWLTFALINSLVFALTYLT